MNTDQAPAVSQSSSDESNRQEWLAAMAEHARYEAFRHRLHSFLTNMENMRESLQINSRITGPETDPGRGMMDLSQQMFESTKRIRQGVPKLDGLYEEIGLKKPLIEAHLRLTAGSADETSAETRVALDRLIKFSQGITLMKRMWDGLMACSRRGQVYLNMARNQAR